MSLDFATHVLSKKPADGIRATPQTQVIPGRELEMAPNNAGGISFTLPSLKAVERFLILGVEGGTYYASEQDHTYQMFDNLRAAIQENPKEVVNLIVAVSDSGRAAKNDPALFALAAVMAFAKKDEDKFYARQAVNKVARIGTHLFHLAKFIDGLKGWGTGTRKAFQNWYLEKDADTLAYQAVKYKYRDGWGHRDVLRKVHPWGTEEQNQVFRLMAHPNAGAEGGSYPPIMWAAHEVNIPGTATKRIVKLIQDFDLPWECLPTTCLNEKAVWDALLPSLKPEAMMRNLGRMTSIGLLVPMSDAAKYVQKTLIDPAKLKRARLHPLKLLNAMNTYGQGKGQLGSLIWNPVQGITSALEDAFTLSFDFTEPSGKNIFIALDVSGSMTLGKIGGTSLTPREASVCMALVTAKTEPNYEIMGFSHTFVNLGIHKNMSYTEVLNRINGMPFGGTDCSLPMLYAKRKGIDVDCFQVYTDNETYSGVIHPSEALEGYRKERNKPNAKLAVVAMTATQFTIADPKDPGMVDFVGFDTAAPQAMANFVSM